jgi:hypothetical protein
MAGPQSKFEELARAAVDNVHAARDAGQQLTFLPDEPAPAAQGDRAKRGKGKATSMLRDFLAARGMRLPEDVLVEMAGMASTEDAFLTAMARTEQVLAWAQAGARDVVQVVKDGVLIEKELDTRPTLGARIAAFQFVYTAQLRAAEALLPYGLGKVTPDDAPQAAVQVFVAPGARAQVQQHGPDQARDVTPKPGRLAPPPLPHEILQDQQVSATPATGADGMARTE